MRAKWVLRSGVSATNAAVNTWRCAHRGAGNFRLFGISEIILHPPAVVRGEYCPLMRILIQEVKPTKTDAGGFFV